jgi:hypothetical protein
MEGKNKTLILKFDSIRKYCLLTKIASFLNLLVELISLWKVVEIKENNK